MNIKFVAVAKFPLDKVKPSLRCGRLVTVRLVHWGRRKVKVVSLTVQR